MCSRDDGPYRAARVAQSQERRVESVSVRELEGSQLISPRAPTHSNSCVMHPLKLKEPREILVCGVSLSARRVFFLGEGSSLCLVF